MKTLLTKDELHAGVTRMAGAITACYERRQLTVIGVLTGSVVVVADLIRLIDLPVRVGMIAASSYRGAVTSPGQLVISDELMPDIAGHDVLLVDDIFDTGHTLVAVKEKIKSYGPASLRTAVLLKKLGRQEVEYEPDFVGFEIPNEFVVGYGLDYADMHRNLPDLAVLEPADIERQQRREAGALAAIARMGLKMHFVSAIRAAAYADRPRPENGRTCRAKRCG